MGDAPRVSLCMIVRDEESCLERCLRSVEGAVSELIVVDTGSRDGTVELARRLGARVEVHDWPGDFAQARNLALGYASGDWVLVLDADEELLPESVPLLGSVLATTTAAAFKVTLRNFNPPGETTRYEDVPLTRLFRNDPRHRFEGAIHEQITPAILRTGGRVDALPALVVLHHGYATTQAQGKSRAERNLRLLEEAIARAPDDSFLRFQLGATLQAAGNKVRAEAELTRALETNRGELPDALVGQARCKLAQLALTRRADAEAAAHAERALAIDPSNAIATQVLGVALAGLGDLRGAHAAFATLAAHERVTAEVRADATRLAAVLGAQKPTK
jgi:tetratricopeptide (TPR) repeat protein